MPREKLIFDTWTPMSFKRAIGGRKQPGVRFEEANWVGEHARRLAAYKVLRAYIDNAAREFLFLTNDADRGDHREYGDASLLVDTILTALLGDSQKIVVKDAADYNPPKGGYDDNDPNKPNVSVGDDPPGAIDTPSEEVKAAWEFQQWLCEAWKTERGALKVVEVERDAVGLGDGVYSVGWSPEKGRARIRTWDPGFFFPVVEDGNEDDFPDKVHIAWEYCPDPTNSTDIRIRRLTWELVPAEPYSVPYQTAKATKSCLYSDASWPLQSGKRTVEDFDPAGATYATEVDDGELVEVNRLDLGIDYVPVIHITNTVAIKNFYGRSSLSAVLQILDDLSNSDTDGQAASATAAKPVLALEGGTLGRIAPQYNAGEVWELGEGKLNLIDTSKALDAVMKYIESLLDRLSINARTPDALLGRVRPSEVPSGVAMAMSFGPLAAMIGEMRMSRYEKYPLLFKFFWRMNLVGEAEGTPDTWYDAEMRFGSYLPQDKAAAVDMISKLMNLPGAQAISIQTAVALLVANGFPIEDAVEEVRRIQSQDFIGADNLRTATGSATTVYEYLQLEMPEDAKLPVAPVIPNDPASDPKAPQNTIKPPGGVGG